MSEVRKLNQAERVDVIAREMKKAFDDGFYAALRVVQSFGSAPITKDDLLKALQRFVDSDRSPSDFMTREHLAKDPK